MCSYLGTFPPALARSIVSMLSEEGDVVLDPFSGRGTTLLEARLTGRIALASDLNPIAVALSRAKNADVRREAVLERIQGLEARYDALLYLPEAQVESDAINLIFHPRTLAQLCYLRHKLLPAATAVDEFLVGAILGVMHGSERQDGSSAYASISMPNTFSMSPEYVRRFVETKQLQRVDRNVFSLLQEKTARLFSEGTAFKSHGVVARGDAKALTAIPEFGEYLGRVNLILCSPPYLDVVNYAKQNWIRTWFLNERIERVSDDLDDNLTLGAWLEFVDQVVGEMRRMLSPDGTVVLVIGDVAKSNRSVISLAREFIRRVLHSRAFAYVGCLSDHLQTDIKTTRIWKDTKGKATAVDRVIILSDATPTFRCDQLGRELMADDLFEVRCPDAASLAENARDFAG